MSDLDGIDLPIEIINELARYKIHTREDIVWGLDGFELNKLIKSACPDHSEADQNCLFVQFDMYYRKLKAQNHQNQVILEEQRKNDAK